MTVFIPRTDALRRALVGCGDASAADLAFLETWEADPLPGPGAALRIVQIRRANPALAAEIRSELDQLARMASIGRTPKKSGGHPAP